MKEVCAYSYGLDDALVMIAPVAADTARVDRLLISVLEPGIAGFSGVPASAEATDHIRAPTQLRSAGMEAVLASRPAWITCAAARHIKHVAPDGVHGRAVGAHQHHAGSGRGKHGTT